MAVPFTVLILPPHCPTHTKYFTDFQGFTMDMVQWKHSRTTITEIQFNSGVHLI